MKGNIMIRMISLMIIVPVFLAHFFGQIDLMQPSWIWLTLFAGFNALQATFTGWCPVSRFLPKDPDTGACCVSDTTGTCCSGSDEKSQASTSCCGDEKEATKSTDCCPDETKTESCCGGEEKLEIKVLGTGCANCANTAKLISETAEQEGVLITIVKVEDVADIAAYGVMSTPGVVIADKVVHSGGIPTKQAVVGWLKQK